MPDHFKRLWSLGYRHLIPIVPPGAPLSEKSSLFRRLQAGRDDRGKVPGIRWPDGNWSSFDWINHETTEDDLARWQAIGAGVGIKTGFDGVVLIDADTLNKEHAYAIRNAVEACIGETPLRIGRSPKAGYVIRTTETVPYHRIEFGGGGSDGRPERVEILGQGRQFVAEGMHPSEKPYRWPVPLVALAALPVVTPEKLAALLETLRSVLPAASPVIREGVASARVVSQEQLKGDRALVRAAVEALPNDYDSRDDYIRVGAAIKAAVGDDGLEIWSEWCDRWSGENAHAVVEADWRRLKPPFDIGAGWLYDIAEKRTGRMFSVERFFTPITENSGSGPKDAAKGLTLISLRAAAESALTDPTEPLIDGLLDQGTMSVVYGESGAGKSFVVMDLSWHIAAGKPWAGMATTKRAVVYVAAEGGRNARKRAAALRKRCGDDVPFYLILSPIDLFHTDADLSPLVAAIRSVTGFEVGLVVLDTLSRVLAGGDENASTDMGILVKHLDTLRNATRVHLLVVHHSGKDRARGARGHSLLRAAVDTEIEIADKQIIATKQRDMEEKAVSAFELDKVDVGVTVKGRRLESATVRLVARNDVSVGVASPREQDVLEAIEVLQSTAPAGETDKVSTSAVADYLSASGACLNSETVRSHLRNLAAKRLIVKKGRGSWSTALEKPKFESLETAESGNVSGNNIFQ